jgi:hypothetical protein
MNMQKSKLVAKKFRHKIPNERRNSEMIRRLLYDQLFSKVSVSENRRGYDRLISANSLHKAVLDKHFIGYAHLNALAKHYNIPISAMLLFTRIRDELEEPETRRDRRATSILTALRATITHLEGKALKAEDSQDCIFEHLGHKGFLEFVAIYQEAFEEVWTQPRFEV